MGLDTTHDCWHGPYSAFKRFRDKVAAVALEHYDYEPDYDAHPLRAFMGWWDFENDYEEHGSCYHPYGDVLDVFFVHSDCDGWIFPNDAIKLADRLEPLVGYLDDDAPMYSRDTLRQFIKGLRHAGENWEVIGFH